MLGTPELDNMVCQRLSPQDQARCARVSKTWHALIVPHLWRDLRWLGWRAERFMSLIQQDYREEQQRQKSQNGGHAMEQLVQPSPPLSALSKYGRWIRLLPDPCRIFSGGSAQEAQELLQHLLQRSPNGQVESVDVDTWSLERTIADLALPRVRHLHIDYNHASSGFSKLMSLLSQCSVTVLQELELNVITPSHTETNDLEEEPTDRDHKSWTSLKRLSLSEWTDDADAKIFWSWLFEGCGQLETLVLHEIRGDASFLAQAILAHLPDLAEIVVGRQGLSFFGIPEDTVATILSASSNGWKTVRLAESAMFGETAAVAFERHFSTLETLEFSKQPSDKVFQVLRACTNLRSFIHSSTSSRLDTMAFIDLDPDTGLLRPWQCETTLKELKVRISGIPRPGPAEEASLVRWYEIQGQFYDRLARLANLETCWLGYGRGKTRHGYLEMSLESGLDRLSGLGSLRDLSVMGLSTKICIKEIQWMVENWPRLRNIRGLYHENEEVKWLQKYHPEISVRGEYM
ncbi:MAG: hypothetical protein J3Q66DRAFT_350859 [Benniella sp.]|nr:MAG: hypothetical protein J3Q66DRAFT_350859 [Benniella sp.]